MSSWGGLLLLNPCQILLLSSPTPDFSFPSTFFQCQSTHGNLDDFSIKVVMSIVAE